MRLDSVTLAAIVSGTASGPVSFFTGVALDSRAAKEGELFVSLKGPRHDGHDYLAEALRRAPGALVSRAVDLSTLPEDRTLIRVPDTLLALRACARHVRATVRPQVVAITGSVGKTTTKEMAAGILGTRFRVAKSAGNLNNGIGIPAEVARWDPDVEVAVLELGMSTPGEIRLLSELVEPDIGVVTAVQSVHTMNFSSIEGVLEAKAEILAGMKRKATFVANADDPRSLSIASRHTGPVRRYGFLEPASTRRLDVTASEIHPVEDGTRFTLHLHGAAESKAPVELRLPGLHNLSNFLAAAAIAQVLGMQADEISVAAHELRPASHRGEIRALGNDVVVYDDSYNSSPAALDAAYRAFETLARGRRKLAVIGEMLELGRESERFHREAGHALASRVHELVAVRGQARLVAEAAKGGGLAATAVHFAEDVAAAIPLVTSLLQAGDAVFVKGSRGVSLDRLVAALSPAPAGVQP